MAQRVAINSKEGGVATATMARGVEEAKTTMMTAPGEAEGRAKAKAGAKGMTLTVTERGVARAEKGRWRRRILCSDGTILICRTFSASIFWI
jgi:hypothetical protein